ncbi:MAG: amidohydrolase, partial [Sphingomonadales bacterium]
MIRTIAKLAMSAAALTLMPASAFADTLVDNVQGITINADGAVERFTALVITDDGDVRETVKAGDAKPDNVEYRVDGQGRVMLPGMIDSHVHVMGIGFGELTLDLSQTNSL